MNTIRYTLNKHLLHAIFIGMLPLLLLRAGVAQASSLAHQKTWRVVASPNAGTSDQLNGIAAISKKDVWTVGDYINSSNIQQTLIEHWNGSSWSIVASPNVGSGDNVLYGVAAVSASDIWAVGSGNGALIEHWDGSSWSIIPNPGSGVLYGVTAVSTSNVWAVGYYSNISDHTLIEQWNGTSWKVIRGAKPGGFGNDLYGVTVVSASDIWAVGRHVVDQYTQDPLIEHWDGTKWNAINGQSYGDYNILLGVASVAANDVWAVGYYSFISSSTDTLIEHWDGSSWSIAASGDIQNSTLSAVAAISANDVWAVGSSTYPQTLTEHWNGTNWSVVPGPNPGLDSALYGITRVPGNTHLWAVGGYSPSNTEQTLTEFYG